jgi:hypothetical protein
VRKLMKDYGKGVMAILGVVLMIAFAIPSFFNGQSNPATMEQGRLAGKKISVADVQAADSDIRILDYFHLARYLIFPQSLDQNHLVRIALDPRDPATHWLLLLTEARNYGLSASEEEINNVIKNDEVEQGVPLTADELRTHLERLGIPEMTLRETVRHVLMVRKLGMLRLGAVPVSIPQLEAAADSTLSKIVVDYALLDADKPADTTPQPAAIEKQFALYKAVEPLGSLESDAIPPTIDGHTYPFGYKYPDRVQVEWLKFDLKDIQSHFKATQEDYEQAYAYYKSHPAEFTRPATQPASQPASSQPATQTAASQAGPIPFDQVRDQLVQQQVQDRGQRMMRRMVDRAVGMAGDPWKSDTTDTQGFRDPLPTDKWADYNTIAGDIAKNREFDGYKPAFGKSTGWMSRAQLHAIPGIGDARCLTQREEFPFPDLALKVKELQADTPAAKRTITTRFGLQVGVEGPLLQDNDGNLYIYRIAAADPAHEPKTLDEVRDRVVEDLKRLAAYQTRQADAAELARQVAAGSPADLLRLARQRQLTARISEPFSRAGLEDHLVAAVPGMIDAAFALADKNPATHPASQPATRAAASQPATATTTLPDDAHLAVYVLALDRYTAATPRDFAQRRIDLWIRQEYANASSFLDNWAALESVARRLHYIPRTPFAARKEES